MLLPIFQLSGVRGVRCTPTEEAALKAAIVQKASLQITQAVTLEDLRGKLNCSASTAMCFLSQRVRDYTMQITDALSQVGTAQPLSEEVLGSLCTGMGLKAPSGRVPDLGAINSKFPQLAGSVYVQQLFHHYIETIGHASGEQWEVTGLRILQLFCSRIKPFIGHLHRTGSLEGCINLLNQHSTESTKILPHVALDRQTDALAKAIYKVFSTRIGFWHSHFCSQIDIRPVIEAKTLDEYYTRADLICNTIRGYIQAYILESHSMESWRHWLIEAIEITEGLDADTLDPFETLPTLNHEGFMEKFLLLYGSMLERWPPQNLTLDQLDHSIQTQTAVNVLSHASVIGSLTPTSEEVLTANTAPHRLIRTMVGSQIEDQRIRRFLDTLVPIIGYLITPIDDSEQYPASQTIAQILAPFAHYTERRLGNASSESLILRLDDLPAEPEGDLDEVLLQQMIRVSFTDTSPAAITRTVQQLPTQSSCSKDVMDQFTVELRSSIRELIRIAPGTRANGLVSSCEPNQYALLHLVRYCRAVPAQTDKQPVILIVGNTSGFIAKACLGLHTRDYIIQIARDVRYHGDTAIPVLGSTGDVMAADLIFTLTDTRSTNRLLWKHGIDGDFTNQTALRAHDIRLPLLSKSMRVTFLDMTDVDPTMQLVALMNVVRLLLSTQALGAPLVVVWSCLSIYLPAVYYLFSLGATYTIEVIGPEYMANPVLSISVILSNPRALISGVPRLPLAIRTALRQVLLNARSDENNHNKIAAESLMEDVRLPFIWQVRSVIPLPAASTNLTASCLCKLAQEVSRALGTLAEDSLRAIYLNRQGRARCIEEVQEELVRVKSFFRSAGLQCSLDFSSSETFSTVAFERLRDCYSALFPSAFAGNTVDTKPPILHVAANQTPEGHTLILAHHSVVIRVQHLQVDVLSDFNEGLMSGYDLHQFVTAVQLLPANEITLRDQSLASCHEDLRYDPCCSRLPATQIVDVLRVRRIQLYRWKQQELKSRVFAVDAAPPPCPSRSASPLRPVGASPRYDPESPDWRSVGQHERSNPRSPQAGPSHYHHGPSKYYE